MHNAVLTDWIKARTQEAELVLSVCTGALLLAKAGLLDGLGPPRTTELLTVGLLQPRQARRWHIRGCDCPSHGSEEADRRAGDVARKGKIGNLALVLIGPPG